MSHDNREEIEMYEKYKKTTEQHILMNMTKIFNVEDMVYASVWKLMCNAIDDEVPVEKRKEYILAEVEKQISKWVQ